MSTLEVADVSIDEKIEKKVNEPSKYRVVIVNDDQTPADWVIELLQTVFKHTREVAEQITFTIHTEGSSTVGVYTYEIAEQKVVESTSLSRSSGFPLQVKLVKD